MLDTALHPLLSSAGHGAGGAGHSTKTPRTEVTHGQGCGEHFLYLQAGFHTCLLISEVLEEPKGAAQSTAALPAAPGASWHFALVPFVQLTTSLSHPRAFHCGAQSESRAKAAHASLKSSLQGFFLAGSLLNRAGAAVLTALCKVIPSAKCRFLVL